jgi:hypothetical protein
MDIYRKILILIIVIVFSYIFFRLLNKRQAIFKMMDEQAKEGFGSVSDDVNDGELASLKKNKIYTNPVQIQSIKSQNQNIELQQCCIKASYNTAYSGSFVNPDMIKFVLSRGCRFLDFEVLSIDKAPYVGLTTDPTYTDMTSQNKILLDNALSSVVSNGFSDNSPNLNDPIFIQLRIKSQSNDVYKQVAASIEHVLSPKLYKKSDGKTAAKVTGKTKLSDIMGKVILVIDSTINPNYKDFVRCGPSETGCIDLSKYVNIETGGSDWLTYKNNMAMGMMNRPINMNSADPRKSTADSLKMVTPDNPPTNPKMFDLLKKHGIQTAQYMFYLPDDELYKYEEMFNYYNSAFLPMGYALSYVEKTIM